jgi:hypothetical protein
MRFLATVFAVLLFATSLVTGAVFMGCGNSKSTSHGSTVDSGSVDASDDTGDVATFDAGLGCAEQDASVYPAKHHPIPQVDFNGGQVIKTPVVVTITFDYVVIKQPDSGAPDSGQPDTGSAEDAGMPGDGGGSEAGSAEAGAMEAGPVEAGPADSGMPDTGTPDTGTPDAAPLVGPDPYAPTLEQFGDTITTTSWWKAAVGAYGIGTGMGGGHIRLPDSLGPGMGTISNSNISDDQVQAFIQQEITAGALPQPSDDVIYALYFPSTTTITYFGALSCEQFGGYHGATEVMDQAGNTWWPSYAVLPRCNFGNLSTLDQITFAASHEFAEASSDPGVENELA